MASISTTKVQLLMRSVSSCQECHSFQAKRQKNENPLVDTGWKAQITQNAISFHLQKKTRTFFFLFFLRNSVCTFCKWTTWQLLSEYKAIWVTVKNKDTQTYDDTVLLDQSSGWTPAQSDANEDAGSSRKFLVLVPRSFAFNQNRPSAEIIMDKKKKPTGVFKSSDEHLARQAA